MLILTAAQQDLLPQMKFNNVQLMFKSNIRVGKNLSVTLTMALSISETAHLLSCSHTTKTSSEQQVCGWKKLVDESGQRRVTLLTGADRKATTAQITTPYSCDQLLVIDHLL